jgi:hypothetical protein
MTTNIQSPDKSLLKLQIISELEKVNPKKSLFAQFIHVCLKQPHPGKYDELFDEITTQWKEDKMGILNNIGARTVNLIFQYKSL